MDNLFCMEIDPNVESDEGPDLGGSAGGGMKSMIADLTKQFGTSIPGIDEIMSFTELMRHVQRLEFDVTVFDTAPTGHTLRLLSLPGSIDKALTSILSLSDRFGPALGAMRGMMGGEGSGLPSETEVVGKLQEFKGEWGAWIRREGGGCGLARGSLRAAAGVWPYLPRCPPHSPRRRH